MSFFRYASAFSVLLVSTVWPAWATSSLEDFKRPTTIPFPADNPYTPEKAALGKALFFEPRLSGAENMTCASCHNPSFGWEVPVETAVGSQNTRLGRQAPTVLGSAWIHPFFWDGRAATAEAQAKGPIESPAEMNLPLEVAVQRLSAIKGYSAWFDQVFPGTSVTPDTIVAAIATFERTVVPSYAPFDAWVDGDADAISDSAKRGFDLFVGKARCAGCHTGWNFTDNKFHDIGTTDADPGRGTFEPANPKAQFAFKTPSLRDIAQRGPYMHNGKVPTLQAAVEHYLSGGIDRPSRSSLMAPVDLTAADIQDLVEFLHSLTGSRQVVALPVLPN
ncbi:cytochrome-c peroxidase [Chthonobacter albigriseus]|uniref:cytochrome-c peroxidase n=1 Tax=Chthonobacter albigriseus TaxID=1683161 RepID=UPI0015EF2A21|nr:cytochrome c peroxidase [Chthonobacter albigriseus]